MFVPIVCSSTLQREFGGCPRGETRLSNVQNRAERAAGHTYALESTAGLLAVPIWNVETNVVLTTNQLTLSNFSPAIFGNRFFRLRSTAQNLA
jgi:hypothetical protein